MNVTLANYLHAGLVLSSSFDPKSHRRRDTDFGLFQIIARPPRFPPDSTDIGQEKSVSIRNLENLLAPKSVALIGASTRPAALGAIVASNLARGGFSGPLWLINSKGGSLAGQPLYRSVAELPAAPDLAVIATPPATIPGLVADLGAKGTRAAVVITAGVTQELRQAMLDAARPHLLRVQGPNCLGLMLPPIGLDASFAHRLPPPGDLALVSQSGALITAIVDWASGRGIGFSHVISLGDMADVDFGDLLDYLAGDTQSRAILLYMEQLTHAPKFMSAARRAARAKPVIAIKAGRHGEGARAAMSHTGALAGSDEAYDAAFRRAGILRVQELEDLFGAAEILARTKRLEGERLLILTNGGGAGVLAADRLADLDGRLGVLPPQLVTTLDTALPATWSRANPVDIIGDADAERYRTTLSHLLASDAADAILVMNCPTAIATGESIARAVVEEAKAGQTRVAGKPVLACWLGDGAASPGRRVLGEAKIPTFETPSASIEGFMQLVRYKRAQVELMQTPPQLPEGRQPDASAAKAVIDGALASGRSTLSEVEAKRILAAYGIPTVETRVTTSAAEVHAVSAEVLRTAKTCVIKVISDDISHKSDIGGVRLDIATPEAAQRAAIEILERIERERPGSRVSGFSVQPMVKRPRAHELIIGMSHDATFGPLLLFGAGGTAVEVLRDTAMALPPLDLKLARELMRQTRIHRLLEGYRDRPAANLDAIAMSLVRLAAMVIEHPEIMEIDVNPLLADETGIIALDARVRVDAQSPRQPLAIRPYPVSWTRQVNLPVIGQLMLRPIRPEDEWLYEAFLDRVTTADMRSRFLAAQSRLPHKFIARLTQIDYAREMAFVAIDAVSGALSGVSRLSADPDLERAEFAVLVASDIKGRGLGWQLMQVLIDYARAEGIGELFGSVLAENATMLKMCSELGFQIENDPHDGSVRQVTLQLLPK